MQNRVTVPALIAFLLVGLASYCAVKYSKSTRFPANDGAAVVESAVPTAETALEKVQAVASVPQSEKIKPAEPAKSLPSEMKKTSVKMHLVKPVVIAEAEDPAPEATPLPDQTAKPSPSAEPLQKPEAKAEPVKFKPAEPQLDLAEEISAVEQTEQGSGHDEAKEVAHEKNPTPTITTEIETTVKVTPPEPAPVNLQPEVADAPAPSLGPPTAAEEKPLLDQLTFSPQVGFYAVKTSRASNAQNLQLATKLSPGFQFGLQQNWSNDFSTYGTLSYRSYTFEEISGVAAQNLSGSCYSGILGANLKQADKYTVGVFAGLAQDFAVNVTSANVLEPVKFSRPEAGVKLKADLVKTEKAALSLTPKTTYVFGGTHASDKSKGHLEYGIKLGFEKTAQKIFSSTGAEIEFTRSKFDSTQGKTTTAALELRLNFSFGY